MRARTPEIAQEFADRLLEYGPQVVERLGTRNDRNIILVVRGVRADGGPIAVVRDWTSIECKEDAGALAIPHELVHWHAVGAWDTLPLGVEEGMATLIAVHLVAPEVGVTLRPPDPAFLDGVLELDVTRWSLLQDPYRYESAAWVYAAIGSDELRELARRAEREGFERIPPQWVALPPAEPLFVGGPQGSEWTIEIGRPFPDG